MCWAVACNLTLFSSVDSFSLVQYSPNKKPIHPGAYIRAEILDPLGLTVSDAAIALRVSRPTLSTLLNKGSALSAEMAIRIEKAFGFPMEKLLEMQFSFDIAAARDRAGEIDVPKFTKRVDKNAQSALF